MSQPTKQKQQNNQINHLKTSSKILELGFYILVIA